MVIHLHGLKVEQHIARFDLMVFLHVNIEDEINKALWEAQDEYGVKDDDKLKIV